MGAKNDGTVEEIAKGEFSGAGEECISSVDFKYSLVDILICIVYLSIHVSGRWSLVYEWVVPVRFSHKNIVNLSNCIKLMKLPFFFFGCNEG